VFRLRNQSEMKKSRSLALSKSDCRQCCLTVPGTDSHKLHHLRRNRSPFSTAADLERWLDPAVFQRRSEDFAVAGLLHWSTRGGQRSHPCHALCGSLSNLFSERQTHHPALSRILLFCQINGLSLVQEMRSKRHDFFSGLHSAGHHNFLFPD
jgi:hypothetical protein